MLSLGLLGLWCRVRGHRWGADLRVHEAGILWQAGVVCLRCEFWVETYHHECGQTGAGKAIGRPYGSP